MPTAYAKRPFSALTSYLPIQTGGGWLHQVPPTETHEVWLWMVNRDNTNQSFVQIFYGGAPAEKDAIRFYITQRSGPVLAIPGFILLGGSGIQVDSSGGQLCSVYGYINKLN